MLSKRLDFFKCCLCAAIVISISAFAGCGSNEPPAIESGYHHAVCEGMADRGAAFLACGTGGRLDRIFEDGAIENISLPTGSGDLLAILVGEEMTIVGGSRGTLAYSHDGREFKASKGAGNEHILGLAYFNGRYYACAYSGKILSSADGMTWKAERRLTEKPLIAIAADSSYLMAITQDTDIFKTEDGASWDLQNYNEVYRGLADEQIFQNMLNLNDSIYVIGRLYDSSEVPSVMYTIDGGELWMGVASQKINDNPPEEYYPLAIYSLCHFGSEMLAACDSGRILSFTDCPACNKMTTASNADLRCIAASGSVVLAAGGGFEFSILSEKDFQG